MSRVVEIRELTRAHLLGFLREPEAVFWVFVFPLVLSAVLGFAFRTGKVEPSVVGIIGDEAPPVLAEAIERDEFIETELFATRDDALARLRSGAIDVLLEPGDPARLTLDPVRPPAEAARLRVEQALSRAEGVSAPPVEIAEMTERGSRYIDFLFPGLLGMNLMGTGMWGVGFAIADIRRRKLLRRYLVTPMRRSSFFLSFMVWRVLFLSIELTVITTFGVWLLGVPFRGDPLSFAAVCVLGAMTFAGIGVLVAARTRTIQGASGLMNFVMMPMWLASGVFFSYERFPEAIHPVIQLLPLTALNDALRGIMIDGESIFGRAKEVAIMAGWCVATIAVALKIFRWE